MFVGFVTCGCFGNVCTCIYCLLYCLYCVFGIVLCIFIPICFVCTSVRTTAPSDNSITVSKYVIIIIIIIIIIKSYSTNGGKGDSKDKNGKEQTHKRKGEIKNVTIIRLFM